MIQFKDLDAAKARLMGALDGIAPNQGGDVLSILEAVDHLIQIRLALRFPPTNIDQQIGGGGL